MTAHAAFYEGSSNWILRAVLPTGLTPGIGYLYPQKESSIGDWKQKIFDLPHKDVAMRHLYSLGAQIAINAGIPTHYTNISPGVLRIKLFRKSELGQKLQPGYKNMMIPLEVIYRKEIHPSASILRKWPAIFEKTGVKPWEEHGLDHMPEVGEVLETPIIHCTTKLAPTDEPISNNEAMKLAGLTDKEISTIRNYVKRLAEAEREHFEPLGYDCIDGKFEFAKDENDNIVLADTGLNLYDNRGFVTIEADRGHGVEKFRVDFSRQYMRDYLKNIGWSSQLSWAKQGRKNWITVTGQEPPKPWQGSCWGPEEYLEKTSTATPNRHVDAKDLFDEMYVTAAMEFANMSKPDGMTVRPKEVVAKEMWELEQRMIKDKAAYTFFPKPVPITG